MEKFQIRNKTILPIAVLILTISFSACSERPELSNGQELIIGTYFAFPAMLTLENDGSYRLWGTTVTGVPNVREGNYIIENGRLILSSGEFGHVFIIDNGRLVFESSRWLENWVEPGTHFYLSGEEHSVMP